ncbi:tRNA pseudouridine(55) synthase TruB [Frigoribacterium sp. ACAM 257]|uniref:tRNA pseudouridine(55) synthase TruB n=1 Tax=Frigoribacterium sp. ACAM 257 TaxID=2508998 RepID=UPI0011B968C3|nr:tRNA pseudouridine(55) synthase TruB [Frigoribacterium sp. ACAM 257]TWX40510.1 tRNA pseudouridine(55) synthase TruB [Frigoribacterium sp. ACAM 257]
MNSGILLVDKPQGITSHDVVARVRKAAGTRKVGHAGTLDPLATGLLVLGLNSSTRLLTFLVGLDKTYEATIRLGVSTASDDAEGEVTATADASGVADDAVDAGIADLTGPISQVPTTVSAIKVGGRRAYDLAREGVEVELKARDVVVSEFVVLDRRDVVVDGVAVRDLDVRVSCSSGTYVRALARDLGGALGVGGHLTALRRTRVGSFDVADAVVLEGIEVAPALLAPSAVASSLFPVWSMTADEAIDLGHGKRPTTGRADTEGPVAAVTASGDLAGLVSVRGGRAVPIVNFPTDEVNA